MKKYKKYLIIFAIVLAALLVAPIVRWAVVGAYDSVSSSIRNQIRDAELRDHWARRAKIEKRERECEAKTGYPAKRIRDAQINCSIDKKRCPRKDRNRYIVSKESTHPLAKATYDAKMAMHAYSSAKCTRDKAYTVFFRLCTVDEIATDRANKAELKATYERLQEAWVAYVDRKHADSEAEMDAKRAKYHACLRGE